MHSGSSAFESSSCSNAATSPTTGDDALQSKSIRVPSLPPCCTQQHYTRAGRTVPSSTVACRRYRRSGRASLSWLNPLSFADASSRAPSPQASPHHAALLIPPLPRPSLRTDTPTSKQRPRSSKASLSNAPIKKGKTEDANQLPTSSSSSSTPLPPAASLSATTPSTATTAAAASSTSSSHKRHRADAPGKKGN